MKLISARFFGLKGIYRKSGIKNVDIDFTKCIHNIIMIVGKNGSGKSTLMHALNPLPDSPQMYLDNEPGLKNIVYADGDILYEIEIRYPILNSGSRGTTKAFFRETINGVCTELNANGTINSFKDIVFDRFNLDANFLSLLRLSIEDRGLVEKTPNERKRYIGNILDSVEVYNDIYKTMVKRSGVFKSMINSISAKIDTIGDENKLTMDINYINTRIMCLENERESINSIIADTKAKINVLDPDKTLEKSYHDLVTKVDKLNESIAVAEKAVTFLSTSLNIDPDSKSAATKYADLQNIKNGLVSAIDSKQEQIKFILTSREEDARQVIVKSQKLAAYQSDVNISNLKSAIRDSRKQLFEYEKILHEMGIQTDNNISKDEYILGLNTLNAFRDTVMNIKSYASNKAINLACDYILKNENPVKDRQRILDKLVELDYQLDKIKIDISYNNGLIDKLSILKSRPSECTINNCSFIKDALEAVKLEPEKKNASLVQEYNSMQTDYESMDSQANILSETITVYNDLMNVIRAIINNTPILNKLPNGTIFSNIPAFIDRIQRGDLFNDIYDLYKYIDKANVLELYKNESMTLMQLESDYKIYESKIDSIDELSAELEQLNNKIANIDTNIATIHSDILDTQKKSADIDKEILNCNNLISKLNELEELKNSLSTSNMGINTMINTMEKISTSYKELTAASYKLSEINNQLVPLNENREKLRFSLSKLDEYKQELQIYSAKYDKIELIKKYSSPTKGIQTVFMELYMNNTLTIANRLLGLLFDGQLELLKYEINDTEFRIPCRDTITSIVNDDISSCSSAEKSMISMILSFALRHQSSPKFNIPQLDEIDAMLDQWNKSMFPEFLHKLMDILNVEMCLMISHSSEIDLSDVDVIQLTPATNEKIKGNLIFSL